MKNIIIFLSIILVGNSGSVAGDLEKVLFFNSRSIELNQRFSNPSGGLVRYRMVLLLPGQQDSVPARISARRAGIYSFLLPGWGQYYSGHKTKAIVFFATEVLSWTVYAIYKKQGDDKDAEFIGYADTHWDKFKYAQYLEFLSGYTIVVNGTINWNVLNSTESLYPIFSHHLPQTNTQQYYEMIGKYDQFVYGWDDTGPPYNQVSTVQSLRRLKYQDLRYDSNQLLSYARWATAIALTNHVLSALDAAITVNRDNRHQVQTQLRIEQKRISNRFETCAVFRVNW